MHLESRDEQSVWVPAMDMRVEFAKGERIHTENSYKYRPGQAEAMLAAAGFTHEATWTDENGWFAVCLARASSDRLLVNAISPDPGLRSETGHPRVRPFRNSYLSISDVCDSHQQDVVARQFNRHVVGQLHVLAGPQVFGGLRAVQAELGEMRWKGCVE